VTEAATPIPAGFYVTGGTLRRDAPSYVRRRADAELHEGLTQGQFCYVLTSRQMGKSSLMVRTAARLREEGVAVAALDLTAIGQNVTVEQWYGGLLGRLGEQLGLEDELDVLWIAHERQSPMQRWTAALREVVARHRAGQVVVFVDEIDATRSLPFSTDEFFAGIRELYNRRTEEDALRRLTFCLLGVATPSDLIRDPRTTPFNIGRRIELYDFTDAEAAALAPGLGRDEDAGRRLLERVLHWTGGHPYLTQRLCRAVSEDTAVSHPRHVDRVCDEMFLSARARERDDNLLFVRERVLRSEADLAGVLDLYRQVQKRARVDDDETSRFVSVLRLSGITRAVNGRLQVRNRIYRRVFDRPWITANMPEAELRRQRAAFRRGVVRTAAVAGVVLAVIAGLGLTALSLQREAERQTLIALAAKARAERSDMEARAASEQLQREVLKTEVQRQAAVERGAVAEQQRVRADEQVVLNRRLLYASNVKLAQRIFLEAGDLERTWDLLSGVAPRPGEGDFRGFEWHYLWRLSHGYQDIVHEVVWALAVSPNGSVLATGGGEGTVKLWDMNDGRELRTIGARAWLPASDRGIRALAFTPDGAGLVTARGDGDVALWEIGGVSEKAVLEGFAADGTAGPKWAAVSPDGRFVAVGNDSRCRYWDLESRKGTTIATSAAGDQSTEARMMGTAAFSTDGGRLLFASPGPEADEIRELDVNTGQSRALRQLGRQYPLAVVVSPDGRRVAARLTDTLYVRDLQTGVDTLRRTGLATTSGDQPLVWSKDSRLLAAAIDKSVELWDVERGVDLLRIAETGFVQFLALSQDSRSLLTSTSGLVRRWPTVSTSSAIRCDGCQIAGVRFTAAAKELIVAARCGGLRRFDVATRQERTTEGRYTTAAACDDSSSGRSAASGGARPAGDIVMAVAGTSAAVAEGYGRQVTIVDPETLKPMGAFAIEGASRSLDTLALTPQGRTAAVGVGDRVEIWDVVDRRRLRSFDGSTSPLAFSGDGKWLAAVDQERNVVLRDVLTGRTALKLTGHRLVNAMGFSPDGTLLATGGSDQKTRIWETATGRELGTLEGHGQRVTAVSFSPDGRRLATGSEDRTVKLWDVASRQELLTLLHPEAVESVAFSPDGRLLAAGGGDTATVWDATEMPPAALMAEVDIIAHPSCSIVRIDSAEPRALPVADLAIEAGTHRAELACSGVRKTESFIVRPGAKNVVRLGFRQ
jgi:WD40 repeat protein